MNTLGTLFFLKTPQREEIDMIHTHDTHPMPVEVKIGEKVGKDDVKTLFRFMEKNNINKELIITLDTETTFKKNGLTIETIPYWKHWTIFGALSLAGETTL